MEGEGEGHHAVASVDALQGVVEHEGGGAEFVERRAQQLGLGGCEAESVALVVLADGGAVGIIGETAIAQHEAYVHGAVYHLNLVDNVQRQAVAVVVGYAFPFDAVATVYNHAVAHRYHVGLAEEREAAVDVVEVAAPGLVVAAIGVVLAHPGVEHAGEVVAAVDAVGQHDAVTLAVEGRGVGHMAAVALGAHMLLGGTILVEVAVGITVVQRGGYTAAAVGTRDVAVEVVVLYHGVLGVANDTAHVQAVVVEHLHVVVHHHRGGSGALAFEEAALAGCCAVEVTGYTADEEAAQTAVVTGLRVGDVRRGTVADHTAAVDGIAHILGLRREVGQPVVVRET